MRDCPVCEAHEGTPIFSMAYHIPDGWPLPSKIDWYTCDTCGMIYGDGDFDQALLNEYYTTYYGYGVNSPANVERLRADADRIAAVSSYDDFVVDFGGAGDDGRSVLADRLKALGYKAVCVNPGDKIPEADIIYASHVIEHIYDLPQTMREIVNALAPDGLLIIDVPNATGLLQRWRMPILDFNTKHINHFTLRNLLDLGHHHGLEMVEVRGYEMEFAPAFQVHFRRLDVAIESFRHIRTSIIGKRASLIMIGSQPVNIWGMGDITWHVLTQVDVNLNVLNYIDNDPAYRGQTYKGKPVLERPDNDAPILILAQGQRQRLIENIRKMGIKNAIIEV